MKALFVALVALLFAFFLGCQSSLTDPLLENTNYKDAVSYWPGVINFDTDICEPIHQTCNTTVIAGVIRYKVDEFISPGTSTNSKKVSTYINATVKGLDAVWTVYGMSEEIVYLSNINEQVYIFDRYPPDWTTAGPGGHDREPYREDRTIPGRRIRDAYRAVVKTEVGVRRNSDQVVQVLS